MSIVQKLVVKHFNNIFATGGNNIVEVFESLTASFWTMNTPLFRGIWCLITFDVILTITNDISKNLPSSSTQWCPIITYVHPSAIDLRQVSGFSTNKTDHHDIAEILLKVALNTITITIAITIINIVINHPIKVQSPFWFVKSPHFKRLHVCSRNL